MLKLTVIGNTGNDAEVREHGDQSVISFNLAHSERYRDQQGQQQERTVWVRCSYWRKKGETNLAQYLKKGTKVYVEGFPTVNTFTKADGSFAASLEVRVSQLELVGPTQRDGTQPQSAPEPRVVANAAAPQEDDDLPF